MCGSEKGGGDVLATPANGTAPLRTAVGGVRLKDELFLPQKVLLSGPLHVTDLDEIYGWRDEEIRSSAKREKGLTGTVKVPSQAAPSA